MQMPRIGVGVIVKKNDRVLLGKRINSHGHGTWSFPGGHLEQGEEIESCAIREVFEETGLEVTNIRKATFTNDIFNEVEKHYVTLFMIADCHEGTPQVREPEKCEQWEWFDWNKLPAPLFLPIQNLLETGFTIK